MGDDACHFSVPPLLHVQPWHRVVMAHLLRCVRGSLLRFVRGQYSQFRTPKKSLMTISTSSNVTGIFVREKKWWGWCDDGRQRRHFLHAVQHPRHFLWHIIMAQLQRLYIRFIGRKNNNQSSRNRTFPFWSFRFKRTVQTAPSGAKNPTSWAFFHSSLAHIIRLVNCCVRLTWGTLDMVVYGGISPWWCRRDRIGRSIMFGFHVIFHRCHWQMSNDMI